MIPNPLGRFLLLGSAVVVLSLVVLADRFVERSAETTPERTQKPDGWGLPLAPEDHLEARRIAFWRRHEVYRRIAREVLAGRMTLLVGACWCRDLAETNPEFFWPDFRRAFAGATDEERHLREVVEIVRLELPPGTEQSNAMIARLDAQVAEHIRRGPVQLPR
jgi:hypothetical protein